MVPEPDGGIYSAVGRFAIVPEWVYDGASPQALRLYTCLAAKYADRETGVAKPSRSRLASDMGCSTDTIDRAVRELVDIRALLVHKNDEPSRGHVASSYTVLAHRPAVPALAAPMRPPSRTHAASPSRTHAAPFPEPVHPEGVFAIATPPDAESRQTALPGVQHPEQEVWAAYKAKIQPKAVKYPREQIKARLRTYSVPQLLQAIDHMARSSWWMEKCGWRGGEWFFAKDSRIEQLLHLDPDTDNRSRAQAAKPHYRNGYDDGPNVKAVYLEPDPNAEPEELPF